MLDTIAQFCYKELYLVAARDRSAIESLKELGLTEYEARLYLSALTNGSMPVRELAFRAGVPRTKAYQSIRSLAKKGLMELKGNPVRFFAVDVYEVFDSTIKEEERRLRELKNSFAKIRKLREEGLKGKSIAEGRYHIYVARESEAKLAELMEQAQNSFHAVVDAYWLNLMTSGSCKKQLASLSIREVDTKIIVSDREIAELNAGQGLDMPSKVRAGSVLDGRSLFISDRESVFVGNSSTGNAVLITLGDFASLVDNSVFSSLWKDSLELNRFMRLQSLGLAEELNILRGLDQLLKSLLESLLSREEKDSLNSLSLEFFQRLASSVPSRIFTLPPEAGLPAWAELVDLSLGEDGRLRYDDVTKIMTIEMNRKVEKLPADAWFIAFLGYLQYNGIPLKIIDKLDSQNGSIIQCKITWPILA